MGQRTASAGNRKQNRMQGMGTGMVTVGIDVSDRYSHFCVVGDDGEVAREQRVRTTEQELTRALVLVPGAQLVMEVGPRSPWMSRLFTRLGHEVILANPRQVALIARSQRKTDRSDAEQLARLGRFDAKLLFPIRHQGEQAPANLQTLRSRDAVVSARTKLVNHVRGAVKAWGAALLSCTTAASPKKVREHIPEELRPALEPMLDIIAELTLQIREFDKTIEEMCERYPETAVMRQIVGVGPITALTFSLTIEDPERFPKSREVGAYLGLVQAAHYILGPFGPDTDLRRWGLRYAESGAGNAKKRAVVAVARKLAVLMLALWKSGEVYEPLRHAHAAEAA